MLQRILKIKMLVHGDCVWWIVLSLFLLSLTKDIGAQRIKSPAPDFRRHRIVHPVLHHGRTKREISSTRHTEGLHHPEVTMTLAIEGEEHILDLRLNEDLVAGDHVISYQKDGKTVLHKPTIEELDICQYSGKVRGKKDSWVALSTCHGVRGVIHDGKQMKYVEPAQVEDTEIGSKHYVYDHSDLTSHFHCGYQGGVTNNTEYDPELMRRHLTEQSIGKSRVNRYKRDTSEDTEVRGPFNVNKKSRFVELVLVADNGEYRANGENIHTVHRQLKDVANIINSVYAPLNIFIALVGVVVWTEQDRIRLEDDGDATLTHFLTYRRETLLNEIPNDNAHLLTRKKFKDGVVGKALKGPICTYQYSGGVAANHSEVIGLVATTIAHEMGHNFGMEHDTETDCKCQDEKCIMSPSSTSVTPTQWSDCSLRSLALSFERGMDYCLRNKPKRLFDSPTCGNGFVEPGEQCDCGLRADAACAACCHPRACVLRHNATCASGECCDPLTCRPSSAGTVCRSAERECDLPEYCTGVSEFCPKDVHKMDATPCSNDQAYCVQGSCRTHTDQCRLLWGSTGSSSDVQCYNNSNIKGDKKGNCGYRRATERDPAQYYRCASEDALCGLLQCRHLNERLEYGMETVATLCAAFINNNGTIIVCRTAMLDMGTQDVDPGLVPDGAKCGENKMCLKQKCVSVLAVREQMSRRESSVCPSDCSGHGVCNSEGHCHCDAGFAPPLCALPGPGGSIDSGPATDSSIQRNFMVAMYIIFLGILPSILLVLFLLYYSRHNVLLWWKKPRKTVQSPKKNSLQRRLSRSASKFAANFQNSAQNNAQPVNVHTLSNPDDMSSSLLRSDSEHSPSGNLNPSVNFFGNFKGFSLTPIDKDPPQNETKGKSDVSKSAKITPVHRSGSNSQNLGQALKPVMRSAPPLPVVPITTKPNTSPSVKRTNSSVQNRIKALIASEKEEEPIVSNPVPRPVISSPILEASTCTAKELISPLQGSKTMGPIRAAPTVPNFSPNLPQRPLSMHSAGNVLQKPLPEEPKKVKEGISINRIASFLKQEKHKEKERNPVERSHSLPKNSNNQVKLLKTADKAGLRNLQISNPILQKDIELSVNTVPVVSDSEDGDDSKAFVNRAQSMRAPLSQKPTIQSFGSMRQAAGAPRPLSCVGRPTAPPPPLPNQSKAPEEPTIYHKPKQIEVKSTDYVDAIEEKPAPLAHIDEESGDNIYAVIEESPEHRYKPLSKSLQNKNPKTLPAEEYKTPKPINSNSGSTESMGLLGEIVCEIQNRNFDSIYSASTLSRKKEKERINAENKRDSTYMNSDYKTPESVYSNSGAKSTASTTSSGYLHPSAVNVPTYMQKEDSKQETDKTNSKIPTFTRQVTPPGLRTSTFKSVPQSPKTVPKSLKTIPNSPDLVSSCTVPDAKNVKAPDVINNNKVEPPKLAVKPTTTLKSNDNRPPLRPAPVVDKKPAKTTPALKPTNLSTNITKIDKNPPLNRTNSKTDSNVKAIADSMNKNRPKIVPKPSAITQKTDTNIKPNTTKLATKPSNVASLQQKFENRKSLGKDIAAKK
ncbi:disintegrin and metalloproteinase domain-containing protein 12 [Bicyclus anynana]|uniref:Disintegrin and metalloproteinase domain-containing protein 12 n=1 Tax=Bicyclus anynana TaxID=110368 RepID=A0A6J1MS74_BICAN|nr:disintegrin and metalloproteinase domain-containing protein 12 [Bicyclus anynana]